MSTRISRHLFIAMLDHAGNTAVNSNGIDPLIGRAQLPSGRRDSSDGPRGNSEPDMAYMRINICVLCLVAAAGISSCGGGLGVTGDFTVAATPGTQTSGGGGSTTFTVTVTGTGGFSGNVTLSASGLPAGATASFSPSVVMGTGPSTMTVLTSSSTPAASSTVTIIRNERKSESLGAAGNAGYDQCGDNHRADDARRRHYGAARNFGCE